MHRGDIRELGEAGATRDRVPPGLAVAARAAIVHQRDRVAVVHPGLDPRRERIGVMRLGAAVDDEDRRVRSGALRLDDKTVDRLVRPAAGERHVEVAIAAARRHLRRRRRQDERPVHAAHRPRPRGLADREPDLAIGPHPGRADRTGRCIEPLGPVGRQVVAIQLVAAAALVGDEQPRAVGPPVGDRLAVEVDRQLALRAGNRIEEHRPHHAAALVQHDQSGVTHHR